MKKQTSEPDFIGGQGPLTKEEEVALAQYFTKKKRSEKKRSAIPGKVKSSKKVTA